MDPMPNTGVMRMTASINLYVKVAMAAQCSIVELPNRHKTM